MGGNVIRNSYYCSRSKCAQCGKPLVRFGETRPIVYGFRNGVEVGHVLFRCSSMRGSRRHWRNYMSTSPHKLYAHAEEYRATLVVNSRVGFEVVFIEYIQKLHFFGFASLSAIVRSHASVFRSPSSKHFAKLLADAYFLLRVSKDLIRVGLPTTGIRIDEELSGESTREYIDYVRKRDLTPPRLQSVTTIVCDGNSNVPIKCGKTRRRLNEQWRRC